MAVPGATIPSWINKELIEDALKTLEKDDQINVTECDIQSGANKNEHFSSVIYKANVTYTSLADALFHRSMIIKIPHFEGMKKNVMSTHIFDTEIKVYTKILPEIDRLLKESGDDTILSPRLIFASKDPYIIILENLKEQGYETQKKQYVFEDAKLIFQKLAKWHAVTFSMKDNNAAIKSLSRTIFDKESGPFLTFSMLTFDVLCGIIRTWPGYEMYGDKMASVKEKLFEKLVEILTMNPENPVNVLNHGDFYFKNIMRKNEKESLDIIFHDFQFCAFTTAALDIIAALYNMITTEARDNHRDDLLNIYYNQFKETLSALGHVNYPTKQELDDEISKLGFLEVIITTTLLPFSSLDMELVEEQYPEMKDADFEKPENFMKFGLLALQHPPYVDSLKKYLPQFMENGFLDP